MGKRRKVRDHVRAQSRQRHPSAGAWLPFVHGVILCELADCDGRCENWHLLEPLGHEADAN